jgi:tripartite-type tricarboxylate transporter receptor subunit TctC
VPRVKITPLSALALLIAPLTLAHGDEYPSRSIKLMQPATDGGFSDTLSRLIRQGLPTHLGQTTFIDNRPGAMNMLANKLVS